MPLLLFKVEFLELHLLNIQPQPQVRQQALRQALRLQLGLEGIQVVAWHYLAILDFSQWP